MFEAIMIVLVVFIVLFLLMRKGNLKFWKIVNLDPDEFYNFIKDSDAWRLSNEDTTVKLDGPYRLYVPNLGQQIKVYGVVGLYENSQAKYIKHFKELKD